MYIIDFILKAVCSWNYLAVIQLAVGKDTNLQYSLKMVAKTKTWSLAILAILVIMAATQRGGSSGGSFSGFSSFGTGSYSSGFSSYYGYGGSGGSGTLAAYIIIGILFILSIIFVIILCCLGILPCCSCCTTLNRKLAFRKNHIQYSNMVYTEGRQSQFQHKRGQFEDMLLGVHSGTGKFCYQQRDKEVRMQLTNFYLEKKEPFLDEVTIRGRDEVGQWECRGQFMMRQDGPFLWMLKFYDNPDEAGQTGQWSTLIYLTTQFSQKIEGRWVYDNILPNSAGNWYII